MHLVHGIVLAVTTFPKLNLQAIARALAFGGRFSDGRVILGGMDRNIETLKGNSYCH